MRVTATSLPGVLVIEPTVHADARGFFMESWNARALEAAGLSARFVQDNHSKSDKGVLRGLHFQVRQPQGKLVRVIAGSAFDVAVDLRRTSATFGRWVGIELSGDNKRQLWVPEGFAHGFLTLEDGTEFLYKCTDYYAPELERTLRWNDPAVAIDWPIEAVPQLSDKDADGVALANVEPYA